MSKFIESIYAAVDTVLQKEQELLAAGYAKTERTNELLIDPGEYMLRLFEEFPVMAITWCKP
jgi:hypothetical protein